MCEPVTKRILFSQCAYEVMMYTDYEHDIRNYEIRNSGNRRYAFQEGTGNSVFVELRCYDEHEYILETIVLVNGEVEFEDLAVLVNGEVEFEDLAVLERGNDYHHIRHAIDTFDELVAVHPCQSRVSDEALSEVLA